MAASPQAAGKLLYATYEQLPGPTGSACWSTEIIRELGRHFDLDGLSVKSEDLSHIERFHRARLLRVPVGDGAFLEQLKAFQRALSRQLDSEDYLLCHFTSVWEGMLLASRRRADGYKLIYQVDSLPSIDFRLSHPAQARQVETSLSLKQQEERCFDVADKLLVPTALIRKHLIRRGVAPAKIAVVPPALDLAPFDSGEDRPGQAGTILYLGSLHPWQGVVGLLQALVELPRHLRFKLLLVSDRDQPGFREVQGKIQMLGLVRSVEFIDPVDYAALPALLAQASVCVAPLANHEHNRRAASLPHKVLCYMAARRPVVAARQPVIEGLVEHGRSGLLYPPGDTRGLCDALRKLLLDRELAGQLGNQGRLALEEEHALADSLAALRACYRELLGQPAIGAPAAPPAAETQPSLVRADPAAPQDLAEPFAAEPETRPLPAEALPTPEPAAERGRAGIQEADTDPRPRPAPSPRRDRRSGPAAGDQPAAPPDSAAPAPDQPLSPPRRGRRSGPAAGDQPAAPPASAVPAPDQPPGRAAEPEVIFYSLEDQDTAPRPEAAADGWLVQSAGEVLLESEQERETPIRPAGKGRRYLLGGPSYPVDDEQPEPDAAAEESATRSGTPRGLASDEPALVSDDEVEIIDSDAPAPPPPPRRKKHSSET